MPTFVNKDVEIHYEEYGSGFPLLLIAPGGMRSEASMWERTPWNPVTDLRQHYRVITMDQRNAGRSRAPVSADDGWNVYTRDQLALLDHLGVGSFHVAGMCIGGSYILGLTQAAPERVAAAVLFQPIGLENNRQAFYDMFDSWAADLKSSRPDVPDGAWEAFKHRMYDGDFLFTADRDAVRRCRTPMLVLAGNDLYHPRRISEEIVDLAPNARLIENWKEGDERETARARVLEFLAAHSPGSEHV